MPEGLMNAFFIANKPKNSIIYFFFLQFVHSLVSHERCGRQRQENKKEELILKIFECGCFTTTRFSLLLCSHHRISLPQT